ncbi:MAG: DUF4252 domain-containing protein [Muribaculaceae bacterium]|nr:DUF4252 domain-containing protein [Muribaculaceae bacterium]MDE5845332.1 DUF4252 domain-containing protein [Muribaculaceae bacterium]MDE5857217.1 DUF4252 domain-containing protein [Muribaculaceae bacterium]MDE7154670.1 DUF4252 domain-containing protein [Muribaculaceae bacterium]MDE7369211.1 DUF4252 domain-containing protein [Muribaculaceae bacterium]
MKRIAIILIAAIISLSGTMFANAITVDDCFKEFSSARNAEQVNINSFLMWIAKKCAGNDADAQALKKIDSVRVLDLESCSDDVKSNFTKKMSNVTLDGLDDIVNVSENGNKVRILAQIKNEKIRKLLVMCYGSGDCCLVEINGKFDMSDLDGVVKSQMPKHDDR